jgi:hypothetical protein
MTNTQLRKQHPWYSFDRVFSYNSPWTMVCGGRGIGKTFGAKTYVVKRALRDNKQFIYVRRYKPDISLGKDEFFKDIAYQWPDYDFRVDGNKAQAAHMATRDDKKREWLTLGYFIALSISQSFKSVPFPLVETIIYDEFILEKNGSQYIPNEATVFMNFYNTVDRYQDKTRVLFLSNAVSINNPYFLMYKIKPDDESNEYTQYGKLDDGRHYLTVHFPESADFQASVAKTAFGQFIAGTEYADYAVSNEFADNNDQLIEFKDSEARYAFSLQTKSGTFSVWTNARTDKWYALARQPRNTTMYTTEPAFMDETKTLLINSDRILQMLRTAFRKGMLKFDEPSTRNAMLDVFKR